jgi:hypothetical protein
MIQLSSGLTHGHRLNYQAALGRATALSHVGFLHRYLEGLEDKSFEIHNGIHRLVKQVDANDANGSYLLPE